METSSDKLTLSFVDNEKLKTELGGAQPGDTIELCLTVTVSAVDDERFEAAIDEVVTEGEPEAEDAKKPEDGEDMDEEDPVMLVISPKKSAK